MSDWVEHGKIDHNGTGKWRIKLNAEVEAKTGTKGVIKLEVNFFFGDE